MAKKVLICPAHDVLTRSDVPVRAGDDRHGLLRRHRPCAARAGRAAAEELGEAEVSDVRLEGGIEQDIVGLDVAVDDPGRAVVVQVA